MRLGGGGAGVRGKATFFILSAAALPVSSPTAPGQGGSMNRTLKQGMRSAAAAALCAPVIVVVVV